MTTTRFRYRPRSTALTLHEARAALHRRFGRALELERRGRRTVVLLRLQPPLPLSYHHTNAQALSAASLWHFNLRTQAEALTSLGYRLLDRRVRRIFPIHATKRPEKAPSAPQDKLSPPIPTPTTSPLTDSTGE
jgi:hypothetical protein